MKWEFVYAIVPLEQKQKKKAGDRCITVEEGRKGQTKMLNLK